MRDGPEADMELIERLRGGDHAAFDTVVRDYHRLLHAYVLRLTRNPDVVDDLIQDLFFRLWKTRETLHPDANLRAYLYTAARHHVFDHLRRGRTVDTVFDLDADTADSVDDTILDPGDVIGQSELSLALANAVQTLPARCREVWILSRDHGLSYAEIAQTTGVSINTVKTQMARAIRVLRAVAEPLLVLTLMYLP